MQPQHEIAFSMVHNAFLFVTDDHWTNWFRKLETGHLLVPVERVANSIRTRPYAEQLETGSEYCESRD